MIILYTGIILILLSVFKKNKFSIWLGFAFVFLVMGFQEGVDGDYMRYKYSFIHSEVARTVQDEPLWDYITNFLHPIGWHTFVVLLSFFQCWVLWRITKRYVCDDYKWLSPILFFFWFGMMLIQMKAMRQALATELCLLPFAIDIKKKKQSWAWCFFPWLSAYLTHNSSVIAVPFVILYYLIEVNRLFASSKDDDKNGYFTPIIVTFIFYLCYFAKSTILNDYLLSLNVWVGDQSRLVGYLLMNEVDGVIFGLSLLIVVADSVFVFLCSWGLRYSQGIVKLFMIMAIVSSFMDVLFFGMGSLARMGYYYLPSMMIALPNLAHFIELRFGKTYTYLFCVFCTAYAMKTSLPWMMSSVNDCFGTYYFMFMK